MHALLLVHARDFSVVFPNKIKSLVGPFRFGPQVPVTADNQQPPLGLLGKKKVTQWTTVKHLARTVRVSTEITHPKKFKKNVSVVLVLKNRP